MKYAKIENNIVKIISYQPVNGWEQVSDNVFAGMIKKSDNTYDYSDDFKLEQEQFKQKEQEKENNKSTGKQKLKDLGLTDAEIKALIGV